MVVNNRYDLITDKRCFDIHREPLLEIYKEVCLFVRVLKGTSNGQSMDVYSLGALYVHSFDVLEQILSEYFFSKGIDYDTH